MSGAAAKDAIRLQDSGLGPRRGVYIDVSREGANCPPESDLESFEFLDGIYRSLCAILYNYVPGSGHPGGSISSGRFVQAILFDAMDYNVANPDAPDADIISYSAGHKALGLYALWALRNEIVRLTNPELLPDESMQFRLEDLLGFRRNPENNTPLFRKLKARALDGHPTPATPFVKLSTGASGVGIGSSMGLALAALDVYRSDAPRMHIVEGEGGLTPGRVAEAMAAAASMGLHNVTLHIDWNQSSIDSNKVCREGTEPGDYVQWDPVELARLHDWNVVYVPDGKDFRQILCAQQKAARFENGQPTAIVYRTVKGWQYGIEGRASHGAGHKLCAAGFYAAIEPLLTQRRIMIPRCEGEQRCKGCDQTIIEECFWEALLAVRSMLADNRGVVDMLGRRIVAARTRLLARNRKPRGDAPKLGHLYRHLVGAVPPELQLKAGQQTTLRGALGDVLGYFNRATDGAFLVASADLVGSTSTNNVTRGFPEGFFHSARNPSSRLMSIGGICEDASTAMLSGLSTFGWHVGVGSSYAAFLAPLGHIAARLHAIGNQARRCLVPDEPNHPFVLVCAHAGLKTGEDGPTHADPQALQLLQENFPRGLVITLTPWDPQEMWPLMVAAFRAMPAVIAPFVTRPNEVVIDRAARGLAPASLAAQGIYPLRLADPKKPRDGTVVLQESGVAYAFVQETLPLLDQAGLNVSAYYVSSAELFDLLPAEQQARIFPDMFAQEAMGITGFTMATMYRWIASATGRAASLHPFAKGHFLGSGQANVVLKEAGLDGRSQFTAILRYVDARRQLRA